MQHIEFFHPDHFQYGYHRRKARRSLAPFIEFFWETDFGSLWSQYPQGFSDALFPNVGYTYMINLGTPFVMALPGGRQEVRTDAFLPRKEYMVCHHLPGTRIFGIKFRVSPIVLEKKVNFSEYRGQLYPLAYLMDRQLMDQIRILPNFDQRVALVSDHYSRIIEAHQGTHRAVAVTTAILTESMEGEGFSIPVESWSQNHQISSRTLQRYFEACTGMGSKEALNLLRIRKALEIMGEDRAAFRPKDLGYYDHSHFYRHLKTFLSGAGPGTAARLLSEWKKASPVSPVL